MQISCLFVTFKNKIFFIYFDYLSCQLLAGKWNDKRKFYKFCNGFLQGMENVILQFALIKQLISTYNLY